VSSQEAPSDSVGSPVEEKAAAVPPNAKRDKHLHQIDLFRLVTFGGVILDHVILGVTSPLNVAANGVGLLLRYTRYGFFALTGFVLTYQYRNRKLDVLDFWRRRYKLIGIPFVVWSLVYWVYLRYRAGGLDALKDIFSSAESIKTAIKSIAYDLITGGAEYHLYFLSVSMQIYFVFPAVLWILKRTNGYHRYLLLVSGAFQAWIMYAMVRPPLPFFSSGAPLTLWRHLEITLLPYQFFVLAGCVAAYHYEAFQAFILRWRVVLFQICAVVIAATLVYYVYDINHTRTTDVDGNGDSGSIADQIWAISRAANVFMLHNVWAMIAIIVALYCIGTYWLQRRTPGSIPARVLRTASDRSFGIYLGHALMLDALYPKIRIPGMNPVLLVIITYVITVALTIYLVEVLRRSPISLWTTGRKRIDISEQNGVRSLIVGCVGVALGVVLRAGFDLFVGNVIAGVGLLLVVSALIVLWQQRNLGEDQRLARRMRLGRSASGGSRSNSASPR
jgi:peptidoglycan/LPS O-acetylase OafA/YrhL